MRHFENPLGFRNPWTGRNDLQPFFRGSRDEAAVRAKARAMARTIPVLLGVVPSHGAAQMRAHGREHMQLPCSIPTGGRDVAFQFHDAACHWMMGK